MAGGINRTRTLLFPVSWLWLSHISPLWQVPLDFELIRVADLGQYNDSGNNTSRSLQGELSWSVRRLPSATTLRPIWTTLLVQKGGPQLVTAAKTNLN